MTNFNKRCAFTLSELLLSLVIVGIIAIITVPVIMNNVQKKMFATQVKNMVAEIENLAQDELQYHNTRDLVNTDFASPEKLLTNEHFKIAKSCPAYTSLKDCWKTSASDNKVVYKTMNKVERNPGARYTIILKNGVILSYKISGHFIGDFIMDINGADKPNIWGRDIFIFYINSKGQVIDYSRMKDYNYGLSSKIIFCKSTPAYCFGGLLDNNWKMDY